jgi:hypothetical protein
MTDTLRARMQAQRLIGDGFADLGTAIAHFGAVQAQDYRAALWAVGQRITGATEATLEAALEARAAIRTWPMRGTLHFVAADDARWITQLLAPRIIKRSAARMRELGIDAATLTKSRTCLERALAGTSLTRTETYAALERAKVSCAGQRGIHILGQLAMTGVLCVAAPRGKQQTFALLDDWIPRSRALTGDDALAELAHRYLASHGPATLEDFAWWTGLNLTEARRALALAPTDPPSSRSRSKLGVHLLPPYDEYTVAYRDRSAVLDPRDHERAKNGIFAPIVLVDGKVTGTWGRTTKARSVAIAVKLWRPATPAVQRGLEAAVARYGAFLGVPATLALNCDLRWSSARRPRTYTVKR